MLNVKGNFSKILLRKSLYKELICNFIFSYLLLSEKGASVKLCLELFKYVLVQASTILLFV